MPVAKHLSYIRLRSRADRPQRIDGPSFAYFSTRHNPCRARAQRTSSEVPAIVATPAAPRSIVRSIAQFAETAGKILIVVATWLLSEILAGWAAHALAMYGLPVAIEEPGDTTACKPSDASVHPPQPAPHVISVVAEADIKTDNFSMPDVGRCAVAHPATPAFRPHELGEQS